MKPIKASIIFPVGVVRAGSALYGSTLKSRAEFQSHEFLPKFLRLTFFILLHKAMYACSSFQFFHMINVTIIFYHYLFGVYWSSQKGLMRPMDYFLFPTAPKYFSPLTSDAMIPDLPVKFDGAFF